MKKFLVTATIELKVERTIEAEDEHEAMEIAEGMNADEWTDYVVSESVQDVDVYRMKRKRKTPWPRPPRF